MSMISPSACPIRKFVEQQRSVCTTGSSALSKVQASRISRQRTWKGLRNPLTPSRFVTSPFTHKPDACGIHAHLATDDAGFGETDEIRLARPWFRRAFHAHDKDVAPHFLQPVPILADHRVAAGRHFRHQPESGAAFLLLSRRGCSAVCASAPNTQYASS